MALSGDMLFRYGLPLAGVIVLGLIAFFMLGSRGKVSQKRMARVTTRRGTVTTKATDAMSLRKTQGGTRVPIIGNFLRGMTSTASLQDKIIRAGLATSAEMFITVCVAIMCAVFLLFIVLKKPVVVAIAVSIVVGILLPRFYLNMRAASRLKRFLTLFPDAIDFIVRGLRSGLPVTESMNMVGKEMAEPIGSIFSEIGESVKLGVTLEKALQETAKKLNSTEFNFFTTSIVLQRETGGNLSEILNNLSDVLRKRFMMRMKIKAMSSEAKATAMIVGSLPFIVTIALTFVSPGYLQPFVSTTSGNIAACVAVTSLCTGVTVMMKMAKFEI